MGAFDNQKNINRESHGSSDHRSLLLFYFNNLIEFTATDFATGLITLENNIKQEKQKDFTQVIAEEGTIQEKNISIFSRIFFLFYLSHSAYGLSGSYSTGLSFDESFDSLFSISIFSGICGLAPPS